MGLLALNIVPHITEVDVFGWNLANVSQNCLHPQKIFVALAAGDGVLVNRLLLSSFIHADDYHLYYNMLSLCYKGVNLERELGSAKFLQLVAFSLVVSHSLMVLLACLLHGFFDYSATFHSCAVGFSAVLFALKYVWNQKADSTTNLYGIYVPTKHAAWAELVLISLITPNASFVGHLAGILAGILYVHALPAFSRLASRLDEGRGAAPTYTYARGFANTPPPTAHQQARPGARSSSGGTGSSYSNSSSSNSSSSSYPSSGSYQGGSSSGGYNSRSSGGSSSGSGISSGSGSGGSGSSSFFGSAVGRQPPPSAPPAPQQQQQQKQQYQQPAPSAPPLPSRGWGVGDEVDVVYVDDIDEGDTTGGAASGTGSGGGSGSGSGGGSGSGSGSGSDPYEADEIRRRRLQRFAK